VPGCSAERSRDPCGFPRIATKYFPLRRGLNVSIAALRRTITRGTLIARISEMPSTEILLNTLAAVANELRWLAIAWHAAFGAIALVIISKRRVSQGALALTLVLPVASVGVISGDAGNPFNGVVFVLLALLLGGVAVTISDGPLTSNRSFLNRAMGVTLVALGLTYPHFLITDRWWSYLYAAPFGLIPCPTLAVVAGATLIFSAFGSRPWAVIVALASLAYGAIGVLVLGVWIDMFLIVGGAAVLFTPARDVELRRFSQPAA
jgi:hypothetical protein